MSLPSLLVRFDGQHQRGPAPSPKVLCEPAVRPGPRLGSVDVGDTGQLQQPRLIGGPGQHRYYVVDNEYLVQVSLLAWSHRQDD